MLKSRRPWLAPVLIVGVALVLRFGLALAFPCIEAQSDAMRYWNRANDLLASGYYGGLQPTAFEPPLYPLFLASELAYTGRSLVFLGLVQAFLGAAATALVYWLGSATMGRREGLIAAAICALNPQAIALNLVPMTENLYVPLLLGGLFAAVPPFTTRRAIVAGVLWGLAALTREVALAFPVFLLLARILLPWALRGLPVRTLLITAATAMCIVLPWTIRNCVQMKTFIAISTSLGENLYFGNNSEPPGYRNTRPYQDRPEVEQYRVLVNDAVSFIAEQPLLFVQRSGPKVWKLVRFRPYGLEISTQMTDFRFDQPAANIWIFLAECHYTLLLVTGALYVLFFLRRDWSIPLVKVCSAFVLYCVLIHIVTFGASRFRFPIEFIVALLAGRVLANWRSMYEGPWLLTGAWPHRQAPLPSASPNAAGHGESLVHCRKHEIES